jgi:hypothetical protein
MAGAWVMWLVGFVSPSWRSVMLSVSGDHGKIGSDEAGRTELANTLLQHLILARQILRLSLVERALVASRRGARKHVIVAMHTT